MFATLFASPVRPQGLLEEEVEEEVLRVSARRLVKLRVAPALAPEAARAEGGSVP